MSLQATRFRKIILTLIVIVKYFSQWNLLNCFVIIIQTEPTKGWFWVWWVIYLYGSCFLMLLLLSAHGHRINHFQKGLMKIWKGHMVVTTLTAGKQEWSHCHKLQGRLVKDSPIFCHAFGFDCNDGLIALRKIRRPSFKPCLMWDTIE